jgi:hypothetical protein
MKPLKYHQSIILFTERKDLSENKLMESKSKEERNGQH